MSESFDPSRERPAFLDQSSPHKPPVTSDSSPPPWYKSYRRNSFTEETDFQEEDLERLTAASTPLHISQCKSALFTSPLKKLDNLNLNNSSPHLPALRASHKDMMRFQTAGKSKFNEVQSSEDYEDDTNNYHGELGDMTFVESGNDSLSDDEDQCRDPLEYHKPPMYVRKRKIGETSTDLITTPTLSSIKKSSHNAEDMSGIIGNETNESLKISFSASDSTPCPPQPRKKLKFKDSTQETTPSQPSRVTSSVLNLNSSKKLSAASVPLLRKLNSATSDMPDEYLSSNSLPAGSKVSSLRSKSCSTPISQSTPSNSRPASPALVTEASDEEINGFKFVKPKLRFSYETPQARETSNNSQNWKVGSSRKLINDFNANYNGMSFENYNIVGKFPVSAAGLMDEEDEQVHIADKRISDPYLLAPNDSSSSEAFSDLFSKYMNSQDKLPLIEHFYKDLDIDEMRRLIDDGRSVRLFYEQISSSGGVEMHNFLKKERLRWHPDKWVSRLEDSPFDKIVIDLLSQEINKLIEMISR